MIPVIAIVGRPSVGKSTLFNRLCRRRDAIVDEAYGVTRDRIYGRTHIAGRTVIVADTGGIDDDNVDALQEQVQEQVRLVLEEADAVLLVVDARAGLTPQDQVVARRLHTMGLKPLLVANKSETRAAAANCAEFFHIGCGAPMALSARQGDGISELRAALEELFDKADEQNGADADADTVREEDAKKAAVVGRPNTGKSTLVNALAAVPRMIVMDEPGTTRDSVSVPMTRGGHTFELIDTAGIRRRARVRGTIEKFSIVKTLQALEETVVALLLLDAHTGVIEQDVRLAGLVTDSGRSLVVVVNKWDGLDAHARDMVRNELQRKLRFLPPHETLFISALHRSNLGKLPGAMERAHQSALSELGSSHLNRILRNALQDRPPPGHPRAPRLKYCHQGGKNPPQIIIHGARTQSLPRSYKRYLANRFQKELNLVGPGVKISFKETGRNQT